MITARAGLTATMLAIFTALPGCGDSGAMQEMPDVRRDPASTRPDTRRVVEATWDTLMLLGGTAEDTVLYDPSYLAASGTDLYLYDSGRRQVGRLTRGGDVLWWFGGPGRGPDEFTAVRDIELDARGHLWVLDVENARITVLGPEGRVRSRIPLVNLPRAERVLPAEHGGAILLTLDTSSPLVEIDADGQTIARHAHPWDRWSALHPLAAQSIAAGDAGSGRFALAFRVGNGFFVFEHGRPLPYLGTFVEHTDFPRIDVRGDRRARTARLQRPVFSAWSMDLEGDRLYVSFVGRSEHRGRLLDLYETPTGRYLRSLALPRSVSEIAVADGVLYALYDTPYPALAAWTAPELE